jgi:hypothetical protein
VPGAHHASPAAQDAQVPYVTPSIGDFTRRPALAQVRRALVLAALGTLVSACAADPVASPCADAAARLQSCLGGYCQDNRIDPLCQVAWDSVGSTPATCEGRALEQAQALLSSSCEEAIHSAKTAADGKADAPCPSWFPQCHDLAPGAAGYDAAVVELGPERMTLEVKVLAFFRWLVDVDDEVMTEVIVQGAGTTQEPGSAELPVIGLLLAFPPGTEGAYVDAIEPVERETVNGVTVAPFRRQTAGDVDADPPEPDADFYGSTDPYPATDVSLGGVQTWRGLPVARLTFNAAQVVPRLKQLTLTKKVRITVRWTAGPATPALRSSRGPIAAAQRATVVNYEDVTGSTAREVTHEYLFIVADPLADALAPLVEQKRAEGLSPLVVRTSELGALPLTPELVRSHIESLYNSYGIDYVLLVGDLDVIPTYLWGEIPSDAWYGLLEGDDLNPEVAVGRLTARTPEELAPVVQKIVAYETGDAAAAWRQKILLVAHQEGYPGKYTAAAEDTRTHDFGLKQPVQFATMYGGEGGTNQQLVAALNDGVGIVAYRGHGLPREWVGWGSTGSFIASKQRLANAEKTPVVLSVACLTLNLTATEITLGEQLVNSPTGGAVAFLGASQPSFNEANNEFLRQLFRAVLEDGITTLGGALAKANAELLKQHGAASYAMDNLKMYAVLGDPSTPLGAGYACDVRAVANAGPDVTLAVGEATTLGGPSQPGASYRWSPADGLSCTDCPNPLARPATTTSYTLTVETDCSRRRDSVTVTVLGSGGGGAP